MENKKIITKGTGFLMLNYFWNNMILLIGLSLMNCLLGCSIERGEVVIEDPEVLSQINRLPIDKHLFEALRRNYPSVIKEFLPTAEEIFNHMVPSQRSLHNFTMGKAEEKSKEIINEYIEAFKKIRAECDKKDFSWNNSFLAKTAYRRNMLEENREFSNVTRYTVLSISDGKISIEVLAYISYREDNKPRLGYPLLLNPLTLEERQLLDDWMPNRDKNIDQQVISILTNRNINKEFMTQWRGIPDEALDWLFYGKGSNKWIYKTWLPDIVEFNFSSDGYVSNVVITKEEKK